MSGREGMVVSRGYLRGVDRVMSRVGGMLELYCSLGRVHRTADNM